MFLTHSYQSLFYATLFVQTLIYPTTIYLNTIYLTLIYLTLIYLILVYLIRFYASSINQIQISLTLIIPTLQLGQRKVESELEGILIEAP